MKLHIAIGVLLTIALLVVALLGPEQSLLSSGPLAAGHAGLDCADCHDSFGSFQGNTKCVACHADQVLTPKVVFAAVRCVACHREHLGRRADLTKVGDDKCFRCHAPASVHAQTPIQLAKKLSEPPRNCQDCHDNHKAHQLHLEPAIAQVRNHLVAAHRGSSPLFHKDTCVKCHQDIGRASGASAAAIPGFFDPHVTHVSRLNIRCTWCHQDVDLSARSGRMFRRLANTSRCVQCHEGEYYRRMPQGEGL